MAPIAVEELGTKVNAMLIAHPDPQAFLTNVRLGLEDVQDILPSEVRHALALREHAFQTRLDSQILLAEITALAETVDSGVGVRLREKRIASYNRAASRSYDKSRFADRPRLETKSVDSRGRIRRYARTPHVAVLTSSSRPYENIVNAVELILAGKKDSEDYHGFRRLDRQRLVAAEALRGTAITATQIARSDYAHLVHLVNKYTN